jgi:hypothetical protein
MYLENQIGKKISQSYATRMFFTALTVSCLSSAYLNILNMV